MKSVFFSLHFRVQTDFSFHIRISILLSYLNLINKNDILYVGDLLISVTLKGALIDGRSPIYKFLPSVGPVSLRAAGLVPSAGIPCRPPAQRSGPRRTASPMGIPCRPVLHWTQSCRGRSRGYSPAPRPGIDMSPCINSHLLYKR